MTTPRMPDPPATESDGPASPIDAEREQTLAEFIFSDTEEGPAGSHHTQYRFPNGYGASVIRGGSMAYGGLEMAVLKFTHEGDNGGICYETPVTDNVLGYLTDDTLREGLVAVHDLPPHFTPTRLATA